MIVENLADKLPIKSVRWKLQRYEELSGFGSGEVLVNELAPPRIVADVALMPMYHDDAAEVQALIDTLDGAINEFYLWRPQKMYPRADPDGSILGAAVPVIEAIGGNNKSLSLSALPAGYVISVGDALAFDFGSSPTYRAYHTANETVAADGTGVTPIFEVRPHLRPGVSEGLAVALVRPAAKVIIVPGSFDPGVATGLVTDGMAFQVMERT